LKKLLSYIILVLFVYNLAGYYVVFKGWQTGIRYQIKKQLRSDFQKGSYDVLKFSKSDIALKKVILDWEKDDEFCYGNSMYDVKSIKETPDSIFYTCINDRREKQLIDRLQAHILQHHENIPSRLANPYKIIDDQVKDYFIEHSINLNVKESIALSRSDTDEAVLSIYIEILSPPPES
jgi:hypothetical protein